MEQMISQCEQALGQEDWSELNITKTINEFESYNICNALGYLFEIKHQVVKRRNSLLSIECPEYLSPLRLHNPEIRLKFSDELGTPFIMIPAGDVPLWYTDIVLDRTIGITGIEYSGPHLVGMVDTSMFRTKFIEEGLYDFLSPLKLVEVSDLHIPHEFN
jgi:hypothetical protein